ncbi:hypothetical protein ANTRET_LOCUS2825 [Anthophora retusa]
MGTLEITVRWWKCLPFGEVHEGFQTWSRRQKENMRFLLALVFIMAALCTFATAQDGYIHLPGKTCKDAPRCPDGSRCVMAPPKCNVGTCGTEKVPTCGWKP